MSNKPSSSHVAFSGSIPEVYDTYLGPLLFEFSGADLAARVAAAIPDKGRVLEVACGTGIATEHLRRALPESVEIVATDLNQAMLDYAAGKRGGLANVCYQQADALELPFESGTFDAVVCQFGIMFFPDKEKGLEQMTRVLAPGGLLAFNVWDSLEANPIARIALETIAGFFEQDPPRFIEVPFGYHDINHVKTLLQRSGYRSLDIHVVSALVEQPNAIAPATGVVQGNPGVLEIRERASADETVITRAVADAITGVYGDGRIEIPLQEIVFCARKPR